MARIGFKPGTKTLSPDSEIVKGGLYAPTTLSAVDSDLATGNIKNGITIFGKVGSADVQDISDATAIAAEVLDPETFYAVSGGRRTGTMPTVAITAVNDDYSAGYHAGNVGGLSAIDVNLAAANILSGVNIFGFVGVATVQEIGAADAVLADVKAGKTFFSDTGGIKTGNLATVTITDANDDYPAGYHAGNVGGLVAIDAQLVTGSIKSGVTIFGVAGHTNVRDVSDADALVGEVKTGSTFYAVGGARKTGTGTQTLNPANENVVAGYYAATTLSAVDVNLAVGNIKDGVNIFGFVGTFAGGALIDDIKGSAETGLTADTVNQCSCSADLIAQDAALTVATKTQAYAAGSRAYAVGFANCCSSETDSMKLELHMAGVEVAESGWLPRCVNTAENIILDFIKAMEGSQECKLVAQNYHAGENGLDISGGRGYGQDTAAMIAIGSIKT